MPGFACHRCRQPLHLPASLTDDVAHGGTLTQSAYDVIEAESVLLQAQRGRRQATTQQSQQCKDAQNDTSEGLEDTSAEKANESRNSLSTRLALTTSLFNMLSITAPSPTTWTPSTNINLPPTSSAARKANQKERRKRARLPIGPNGALTLSIDHPLCGECTNILLSIMETQLDELRRERDAYLAFEQEVKQDMDGETRRNEQSRAYTTQVHVDELIEHAGQAQRDLQEAQAEADRADAELRALDEEESKLEEEERQFWQSMNALTLEASQLSDQRSSLQTSLAQDRAQLNRLELTNVYNDAFSIGYDGGYATINGLRLGRMPNDVRGIEWTEINAAWGQTAFLLVTLARRCNVSFDEYKVHPIGSFSTVEKLGERKETYELYGTADWQLGRLLTDRRFDHAMVAFLECLRQLCHDVQQRDASIKLPHTILRDKIGGASIRLQFGSDETWTRALRNVLMTLKLILAWSINRQDDVEDHQPESVAGVARGNATSQI